MAAASSREAVAKRLFDNLQNDLKNLSIEAKKKHIPVKEAAEACMLKIRMIAQKSSDLLGDLLSSSSEVMQPFIMGCDSKNPKMVNISLTAIQRMIQHEIISATSADNVIKTLWSLMNSGVEELKLLQTAILMITTNSIVQHETLAKALVLGFRLHFTKDSATINTAGATVRQLVSVVFERVMTEDSVPSQEPLETFSVEKLKVSSKAAPTSLRPCAQDGFMLFQDLCQLVNADNPLWLVGITEMTRTFGLELLESAMSSYPQIFLAHREFAFLLKERVCPLIIKLFSPSLKYRQGLPPAPSPAPVERPFFPIVMRLLRIVQSLIKNFYSLLATECEIFLSLLIKFMDCDKPIWQRCIALEVMQRLCAEPPLIRSFVESYDMKPHSTKVFQDIVNAIGSFIQTLFLNPVTGQTSKDASSKPPDTQGAPPALVAGLPVGSGVTPQPAFIYKNVWIPLIMNVPQASVKPVLIDMLEKMDSPAIPDGYALSIGFATLLDIAKSVEVIVLDTNDLPATKQMKIEMVNSSWCGSLASFSLLLDASTDEQATEAILKAEQSYVNMAGLLELPTTRDAFITALCKSSLPTHYALMVLNTYGKQEHRGHTRMSSFEQKVLPTEDAPDRSQVVAVGLPLPTNSMPTSMQNGQVMLTAKNISCMRAILSLAHCHGGVLGTSWHMVLTTLQHLVWILGLKSVAGGQLKPEKSATDNSSAIITTAIMADLPVLSAMLSRLFESSQYLDEVALHHLVGALCKLSNESMELSYNNREASLFAAAKILETGLVNLHRVEVLWKPVTGHLLEVCQHPHSAMRACGVDSVTALILAALRYPFDTPLLENQRLQSMLLAPLKELSTIDHMDIRQKQLDCALLILQNGGETLGPGWPLVLRVIGDGATVNGEAIIRTAFQSMQLIVTDFLPLITVQCLIICVEMSAKFGLQLTELNISLTAIGLLWNISDYFYQQRLKISQDIQTENSSSLTSSDQLWMCLYAKFGELCVDPRPAVRKSAGQTLFATIAAHGNLLQKLSWKNLLWKVLFPLLDNVKKFLETASSEREIDGPEANILMHHSRDTAQKQWSETQVLVMAGVSRVFSLRKTNLEDLDDFPRAWAFLLQYIETAALSYSGEVALAALKSLQELVADHAGEDGLQSCVLPAQSMSRGDMDERSEQSKSTWQAAWKVWLTIGNKSAFILSEQKKMHVPSQAFLVHLLQTFPRIFSNMKRTFVCEMFLELAKVLSCAIATPVSGEISPFLVPSNYDSTMTPVQEVVLDTYRCVCDHLDTTSAASKLYPRLIHQLMVSSELAVNPPKYGLLDVKPANSVKGMHNGYVAPSVTEFAEKCMAMAADLYCSVAQVDCVIKENVLKDMIQSLRVPLSSKYTCPSESTWKLAVHCLLDCLKKGIPLARMNGADFKELWLVLNLVVADFLFQKIGANDTQSLEDFKTDELLDCQVVELIQTDILPYSDQLPTDFVSAMVKILNRGSIHSQTASLRVTAKVRDQFTQKCFETLLQFSFVSKTKGHTSPVSQLAVTTLLTRCTGIIHKYVQDSKLSGNVPLTRSQVNEVASAIKAISTLISSLKKLPPDQVERDIWKSIIELYPVLVDCIHTKAESILGELQAVLAEYGDMLSVPSHNAINGR